MRACEEMKTTFLKTERCHTDARVYWVARIYSERQRTMMRAHGKSTAVLEDSDSGGTRMEMMYVHVETPLSAKTLSSGGTRVG